MNDKNEFPEMYWTDLQTRMETDGAKAVIQFIESFEEKQRRELYSFARMGFAFREWEGKNFDGLIEVAQVGIGEWLRQTRDAEDPELLKELKDGANRLSYNLSADLADCWPGDDLPRKKKHFEEGLKAAENCIQWRTELEKGAGPFAMAYWAKGVHLLSLGRLDEAVSSFEKGLEYDKKISEEKKLPISISPESDGSLLNSMAYLSLAQWSRGDSLQKQKFEKICSAFEQQGQQYPEKKEDAEFYLSQLNKVKSKLIA